VKSLLLLLCILVPTMTNFGQGAVVVGPAVENQTRLKLGCEYSQNARPLNRPSLEGFTLSGHWMWAVDPM